MKIYDYLLDIIKKDGAGCMTLIDPEEQTPEEAARLAEKLEKFGSCAIIMGGSGTSNHSIIDETIKAIKKKVKIPVIIFPGNISDVSKEADAIFFMTLLNSRSRYWLSIAQASSAFVVKRFNLEAIPMAYIIIECGKRTSAAFFGDANEIPHHKPKIAASFALAAQYMGMKLIYFESGSGGLYPISNEMVNFTKKSVDIPIIVGGSIRDGKTAYEKIIAGADFVDIGTVMEEEGENKAKEIIEAVKKAGKEKLQKKI